MMKRNMDEWLQQKIEEDLRAMADEREKMLMEMEELQDIDMPMEKLEEIHRILADEEERASQIPHRKLRLRPVLVAAAVMVLCLGVGLVGTGSRVYVPEIFRRESGDEETTKINTADAVARQYNEEEVCQEIEEKLGVIGVRLAYQPQGMALTGYLVDEELKYAITEYEFGKNRVHVYVSKDSQESSIGYEVDGEDLGSIMVESCGKEVGIYQYRDVENQEYFEVSFEYLNTYYSISGRLELSEFEKIVENILIKNV